MCVFTHTHTHIYIYVQVKERAHLSYFKSKVRIILSEEDMSKTKVEQK